MTDLSIPLTPPECDLRDYRWLPLDVDRLLTSETWVLGNGEECKAAMALWCQSWRQVPAGSLPSDERMLAHLSGAMAAWKKVRDHALRGWVKCQDGRLYHPVVCEKAREAWELKLAQRARTEAARQARDAKRKGPTDDTPPTVTMSVTEDVANSATENATRSVAASVTETATEDVTESTRPDQTRPDQESKKERTPPSASSRARGTGATGTRLPPDWHPSAEDIAFAEQTHLDWRLISASFRDYWHAKAGQAGRKLDWSATWRNWCRREDESRRKQPFAAAPKTAWMDENEPLTLTLGPGGMVQ